MDKKDFFLLLDDICDLDEGTIQGGESLKDAKLIDSLALLGLIALLDKKFGIQMKPMDIQAIGTMNDLFNRVHS